MKNNHCDTPFLPPEMITEILLRLPVKSLLRFKGICKSWLSLIFDPQFGVSHHDLAASPSHRLLLTSYVSDFFRSFDIDAALFVPLHLSLPAPRNQFKYAPAEIVGSCRGLVLLCCNASPDLILWNPSIGVHKRLSGFENRLTLRFLYGFGYDVSTDDYLVILIECRRDCETEIQVYSFKTNSRNTICIDVPYDQMGSYYRAGYLFNGTLHWLVLLQDIDAPPFIIAFDLIQRSLSEIPLLDGPREWMGLREIGGCLGGCCRSFIRPEIEIWVMKEYKMQSSWTKTKSVDLLTPRSVDLLTRFFFYPICITKDGGILGSTKRNCLEKLNTNGEWLERFPHDSRLEGFVEYLHCTPYRESLLSLPSVIGANE